MSERKFGLFFGGFLFLLFFVFWFAIGARFTALAIIGGIFLIIALAAPIILLPFNRLWMRLTGALGHASNHVILGTVFLLLFTPMGWFFRLIKRDVLNRSFDRKKISYFHPVTRQVNAKTLRDWF